MITKPLAVLLPILAVLFLHGCGSGSSPTAPAPATGCTERVELLGGGWVEREVACPTPEPTPEPCSNPRHALAMAPVPEGTLYHAWVDEREQAAVFNFYDLSAIQGAFKVYAAGYVVPSEEIHQDWPQGGKYAQIRFPLALVGGLTEFEFVAVTVTAEAEWSLVSGHFPAPPPRGRFR